MIKKLTGFFIMGLLIATIVPVGSSSIQKTDEKPTTSTIQSFLIGIGLVRIAPLKHEITGFVIIGINTGQVLVNEMIHIQFDETPIRVGGLPPLVFVIKYTPAE